jgi:hypothetical protein
LRSGAPPRITALVTLWCLAAAVASSAQAGTGACAGFEWPLDVALASMSANDIEALPSGANLAAVPRKAFAVAPVQTDVLLALRDRGAVNDRVHQELQIKLDRANADLREG